MTGLATFRPLSRHVLEYHEEGVLTLTSGTTHSAFRTLFLLFRRFTMGTKFTWWKTAAVT
jgi:hypothetical protein